VYIDFLVELNGKLNYSHQKVVVQNFREGFFIDISVKAKVHLDEIFVLSGKWMVIDHLFINIFDELEHPQFRS
jgi:hypothetical protein